jgi:hypothetical protein
MTDKESVMDDVKDGLRTLWDKIFAWLPQLIGALVILLISYMVANALGKLTEKLLHKVNFDDHVHGSRGGGFIERALPRPSRFIGKVMYWIVFIWGVTIALTTLGVPALNDMMSGIYDYLPNVLSAILIFLVAGAIAAAVDGFILRVLGDTPTGKIAAAFAPVIIMGVAVFMILEQLKIAPQIVTVTYAGLMGSIFLGLALAFGLGGRNVAEQMLQRAYDKSMDPNAQYKKDLAAARVRAKEDARKVKNQVKRAA